MIQIFKPTYFLATKLEAFSGRGEGDPYHKDVEDIIILIDGRTELLEEVRQAEFELKEFITAVIRELMALSGIDYVIESSGSVQNNPGRGRIIHMRKKDLGNA